MIGNRLEQDIIRIFQDNITDTFSINSLSKILGKAYPYINKKMNFFIDEGIVRKIDLGNSYQCFLNLASEKTKIFMMMNELNKKDSYIQKNKAMQFDHRDVVFLFNGVFYHVLEEETAQKKSEKTGRNMSVNPTNISVERLVQMIAQGSGRHIIVLNNIERYVNIISKSGDEILLKGLTKKE